MALDMYGAMTGPSAWMMPATWSVTYLWWLWVMWAVMMAGMMLPSALPMLGVFDLTLRQRSGGRSVVRARVYVMAAGHLAVWALFSVLATALQWLLSLTSLLTPMMEMSGRVGSGVLLVVAGVYQLTPLKWACIKTCQNPVLFLVRRWREGTSGALRMGVQYGVTCLGCCWALMLLLFAGGVMNLAVIGALTVFVLVEKLAVVGRWTTCVSGGCLIGLGVWVAAAGF
ncbi:MAG: DUF2182 domain-containing protein [Acidobacteriota bacterium]